MEQEIQLNAHNKQEYPPMHTCEHIINRTMVNLFRMLGRAVSAHIERKKSKLDFALSQAPSEDDIARIETTVNEVIARHLPVTTEFITQEEATGRFDMKRLPEGAFRDGSCGTRRRLRRVSVHRAACREYVRNRHLQDYQSRL